MLTENDPSLAVSDQEALARARHDCDRGLTDLLNEFHHRRAESLVLVKSLKPDDLMRAGHHPAIGRITVHELLHEWAYHDRNHLQQIHSNVRAWLWPFIGNTQRFYGASTA
jgi:hypothetical protein